MVANAFERVANGIQMPQNVQQSSQNVSNMGMSNNNSRTSAPGVEIVENIPSYRIRRWTTLVQAQLFVPERHS
eukprot:2411382-Heterocapsa_arctica.AAC.1